MPVGCDLGGRSLRIQHAGAGVGDVAKDRALFFGKALHGLHQVGNQVGAPLQLHIHVRPRGLHHLILGHHLVLGAHIAAEHHQNSQDQNADNSQVQSKVPTHTVLLLLRLPFEEAPSSNSKNLPALRRPRRRQSRRRQNRQSHRRRASTAAAETAAAKAAAAHPRPAAQKPENRPKPSRNRKR